MLQVLTSYPLAEAEFSPCRANATPELSYREAEVLRCLAWGFSSKDTGEALGISRRTVECHRASVQRKLRARNGPDAVRIAICAGLTMDYPDTDVVPEVDRA